MTEREQPTDAGAGYPEDGQPGTGMDPQDHSENDVPSGRSQESRDGDPGQATGNPKAAGAGGSGDES
jgi:hypothetical protein